VVYFGCPGEEGGSGKAFMAREGIFDCLDAALTWHPEASNAVRRTTSLGNIQAKFRFHGISSHAAAAPHNGRSALDAVELLNIGVQFLREHMLPTARVHYAITDPGSKSPNVVQADAEALYLVRAPKNNETQALFERVMNIAKGAALMTETDLEVTFVKACSNIVNNVVMEQLLDRCMHAIPLPEYTQEELDYAQAFHDTLPDVQIAEPGFEYTPEMRAFIRANQGTALNRFIYPYVPSDKVSSGSTDVGDVSWVCPTAQFDAVTMAAGTPGHSWQIVAQGKSSIAHKGMFYAGTVIAAAAIQLMENEALLAQAKAEFAERVGPEGYICPIPAGIQPQPIR